ncbi:MAG: hypothetical protein N2Z74_01140 [Syntrophales bacterium]|nr:hypothetical protein [Syntrophales bacterium]
MFARLNVLPKYTAMSSYSYSLGEIYLLKLLQSDVKKVATLGLDDGSSGDESVLPEHWGGAKGKGTKGALTLFAQDASSKLVICTAADLMNEEAI